MRTLRLAAALLALALFAFACGGDDEEQADDEVDSEETESPTTSSTTAVTQAVETTAPTTTLTLPPSTTAFDAVEEEDTLVVVVETPSELVEPPTPPGNPRCAAGNNEGELLVEFDALDATQVSKIRVYASTSGQRPILLNGEFSMSEVDTSRGGRWAVPARSLAAGVLLDLAVTSFNQAGQESGWYITTGIYNGPGQPCSQGGASATTLPPTTCSVGCDEEEGGNG